MEKSEIINKDIMEKGNEEYVIVLHGSSQEDENFANHAVQRVEEIFRENNSNLKVFWPKRDLASPFNNLHFCYYATDKISPNFWVKLMSAFEINVLSPEFKKLDFERITPHQIDVKSKNQLLQNESDQWNSMESLKKTNMTYLARCYQVLCKKFRLKYTYLP